MEITATLPTDSGMHVLWDRAHFSGVHDYQTWESELLDDADIEAHIAAGHVVPININSDGVFTITIRAETKRTPEVPEEERNRVLAASEGYLFHSAGHIDISGIEHVGATPAPPLVASGAFPAGKYEAQVFLLDWDDFPSRSDQHPDFLVVIGPLQSVALRRSIQTFDRR